MGSIDFRKRLIVNADDFGRSPAINHAVIRAHREGILTSASLMVAGDAATEAVELARQNPKLGVGLHLTLLCGRSVLPAKEIPGLVSADNSFSDAAVAVGMKYFFQRSLVPQLEREIAAQFGKFADTGLALDHVNGHLNLHLHPTVFQLLLQNSAQWNIRAIRLTHDPFKASLRLSRGRWLYRLTHALIFALLARWAQPKLKRQKIRYATAVFGLLQSGRVTEEYLLGLVPLLPPGDSELYSHPCLENFRDEFDALVSPRARDLIEEAQIELIRYQDL